MTTPDDRRHLIRHLTSGEILRYFTGEVPRKGDHFSLLLAPGGGHAPYDVIYVEWEILTPLADRCGEESRAIVMVRER